MLGNPHLSPSNKLAEIVASSDISDNLTQEPDSISSARAEALAT